MTPQACLQEGKPFFHISLTSSPISGKMVYIRIAKVLRIY